MNKNKANKNSGLLNFIQMAQGQQQTWSTGHFHKVTHENMYMAKKPCEIANYSTNQILDGTCGSRTPAIVAARRYWEIIVIDYVSGLVKRDRALVSASGLEAKFYVAVEQDQPFDDNCFDMVSSCNPEFLQPIRFISLYNFKNLLP